MRMRIAAAVCGIALAVVGVPAAPAAATVKSTCANLYTDTQPAPGNEYVIARACVSWDDTVTGSTWKQTEQRVWNPPGGVNYKLTVHMYANTGTGNGAKDLLSGESLVEGGDFTGRYTAKSEVFVWNYSNTPFCIYLIPSGSNIEHHPC